MRGEALPGKTAKISILDGRFPGNVFQIWANEQQNCSTPALTPKITEVSVAERNSDTWRLSADSVKTIQSTQIDYPRNLPENSLASSPQAKTQSDTKCQKRKTFKGKKLFPDFEDDDISVDELRELEELSKYKYILKEKFGRKEWLEKVQKDKLHKFQTKRDEKPQQSQEEPPALLLQLEDQLPPIRSYSGKISDPPGFGILKKEKHSKSKVNLSVIFAENEEPEATRGVDLSQFDIQLTLQPQLDVGKLSDGSHAGRLVEIKEYPEENPAEVDWVPVVDEADLEEPKVDIFRVEEAREVQQEMEEETIMPPENAEKLEKPLDEARKIDDPPMPPKNHLNDPPITQCHFHIFETQLYSKFDLNPQEFHIKDDPQLEDFDLGTSIHPKDPKMPHIASYRLQEPAKGLDLSDIDLGWVKAEEILTGRDLVQGTEQQEEKIDKDWNELESRLENQLENDGEVEQVLEKAAEEASRILETLVDERSTKSSSYSTLLTEEQVGQNWEVAKWRKHAANHTD